MFSANRINRCVVLLKCSGVCVADLLFEAALCPACSLILPSRYLVNCVNRTGCTVVWTNLSLCLIKYPAMSLYRVVKDYVILGIECHWQLYRRWKGPLVGSHSRRGRGSEDSNLSPCSEIEPPAMTALAELSHVPRLSVLTELSQVPRS